MLFNSEQWFCHKCYYWWQGGLVFESLKYIYYISELEICETSQVAALALILFLECILVILNTHI